METTTSVTAFLAAIALGLMGGALLAEGAILVPFWRSIPAEAFLAWYKQHAAMLQTFFGPLEIAAAALTIAAAGLSWITHDAGRLLFTAAALLSVAVLAVFPLYFQRANGSFATGSIPLDQVAAELRRWSRWHWARTWMGVAALGAAILAAQR